MGLIKTLLPTPGKLLFMVLLLPLVLLLLMAVFGFVFALTSFSLFIVLIISAVISYILVSIIYQLFTKAVKILVVVIIVGVILSYLGILINPTPINNMFNENFNELDQTCLVDEDCVIKQITCDTCVDLLGAPYEAVNVEWTTLCPLKNKEVCSLDTYPPPALNTTCIDSQCQIVEPDES